MVAKRRLTLMRCAYMATAILVIIVLILMSKNFPLDVVAKHQGSVLGSMFYENKAVPLLPTVNRDISQPRKAKTFSPCPLYHLGGDRTKQGPPLCKRVPPVPGSCDIAEELYHSTPANCEGMATGEVCFVKRTTLGHIAECDDKRCGHTLSAATVNVTTGILLWKRFESAQALAEWINDLLLPSGHRKHFGFCFIGCGGDWDYGDHIYDEKNDDDFFTPMEFTQLLLLPPHLPSISSRAGSSHSPGPYININMLFIDSVSHQHFFRSLPKTVKLLEELSSDENLGMTVLDFELVQSVRSRTFETLQALFSGEIDPSVRPFAVLDMPPEPLKTERLLGRLRERGYSTLWLEDLCHLWEWGISKDMLVYNKNLTAAQTWHKLQHTLHQAAIDSMDLTYAMCKVLQANGVPDHFHGPDAVCFNGRFQHEYQLDYLWLYQQTQSRAGRPFFTFMETNVGHEDSGLRVQPLDGPLEKYLHHAASLTNTLTIVMSDHGNSYGKFLEQSMEGRMELFHPHLFMLLPRRVANLLGRSALDALKVNQQRLISYLDVHHMLHSLVLGGWKTVGTKHRFNTTSRGLLEEISPYRTCNDIPRIMPNLCICQDFDMEVEADAYHALFAHMAVGNINNAIQNQYRTSSGRETDRGFGRCQRLNLLSFSNIRKSFQGNTISLKMDLHVPLVPNTPNKYKDGLDYHAPSNDTELFFVAMQLHLGGNNSSSSNILLQTVDRLTPYSKFSACVDSKVKLQLCVCDINATKNVRLGANLPSMKDIMDPINSFLMIENMDAYVSEGSSKCLYLLVRQNKVGGLFYVTNICGGKVFHISFDLEGKGLIISDTMPRETAVFPGQEVFLCMAVKSAPKVEWDWSFSMGHKLVDL